MKQAITMKKFTIPCKFGDKKSPFSLYVGHPVDHNHPLLFQERWLSKKRSGVIPQEVMDSFKKLHDIALDHQCNFADLCVYALNTANSGDDKTAGKESATGKEAAVKASGKQLSNASVEAGVANVKKQEHKKGTNTARVGDNLDKGSVIKTAEHAASLAKMLWPHADETSIATRAFFEGLALYMRDGGYKNSSLSELYNLLIMNDLSYSLSVALDAKGGVIAPAAFQMIYYWLSYDDELSRRVHVLMVNGLFDFAFTSLKGDNKKKFGSMQKEFQRTLAFW